MLALTHLQCERNEQPLFAPLNLTVDQPGCVEVVGPNGAGKTTLLRTLAGIHSMYRGSFAVQPPLYQGHRLGLDETRDALQNLRWHSQLQGVSVTDTQLRDVLAQTGMTRQAWTLVGRLSAGQQRRVSMARWLLSPCKVWLLDEPLTALDSQAQGLLLELMRGHVASGGCVVYSTHLQLAELDKQIVMIEPVAAAA